MTKALLSWLLAVAILSCNFIIAGPPFISDDPDAIEFKHWKTYFASQGLKSNDEFYAFLPHLEINYGACKDIQLHTLIPLAIDKKIGQSATYGPGISEVGAKCRIIHETDTMPQIGTYPILKLPTGDPKKGLGFAKTQLFLPLWIQKSWGKINRKWKSYAGGGYKFTIPHNTRNSWFFGWVTERQLNEKIWIGLELFYLNLKTTGQPRSVSFGYDFGGGVMIKKDWEVIYSIGKNTGLNQLVYYAGLRHTW